MNAMIVIEYTSHASRPYRETFAFLQEASFLLPETATASTEEGA